MTRTSRTTRSRAPSNTPRRPQRPRKPRTEPAPTAPAERTAEEPRRGRREAATRPLWWLQGQRVDGTWISCYCTENEQRARYWLRLVIERGDEDPANIKEGLHEFEDFRIKLLGEEEDDAAE